jgi:hypothetical protein
MKLLALLCFFETFSSLIGWDFSPINIDSSDVSVHHVSTYYGRAFMCVRHERSVSLPTLVEASWPENMIGVKVKAFPSDGAHARRVTSCKGIKQAISDYFRVFFIYA